MEKSILQRLEESQKRWEELAKGIKEVKKDPAYVWGYVDCLTDIIDWCKYEEWVRTKTD